MTCDDSTMDEGKVMSNKQGVSSSYFHECSQVFKEYRLMREFVLFQEQHIRNLYVVPSHASAFKWFGVVFIHDGLYAGAIFRFTLTVSPNYPVREVPEITFEQPIPYHPLVDFASGRLLTTKAFPDWNPDVNQIWQVLLLTKSIFFSLEKDIESFKSLISVSNDKGLTGEISNSEIDLNVVKVLNSDSIALYFNDFEKFQAKVSSIVQESRCRIYEPPVDSEDRNAIIFGPWNPQIHEVIRSDLLLQKKQLEQIKQTSSSSSSTPTTTTTTSNSNTNGHASQGISWVRKKSPGSFPRSFS